MLMRPLRDVHEVNLCRAVPVIQLENRLTDFN
jgi:hypothetical protein